MQALQPKIPDASEIFGSIDEIAAEVAKDKETKAETEEEQEFNLRIQFLLPQQSRELIFRKKKNHRMYRCQM